MAAEDYIDFSDAMNDPSDNCCEDDPELGWANYEPIPNEITAAFEEGILTGDPGRGFRKLGVKP